MRAVGEAPSKAIITGEHFVVHGAWALAAALPRKVKVEVEPAPAFRVVSERIPGKSPELRPLGRVVEEMAREFSVSPKLKVSVTSEVPAGAGLGSSASTMVALAASVSRLYSLGLGVDEIIRFSMVGEGDIHGRPSGIDPTVCAHGGAVLFRPGSKVKVVPLDSPRTLIISNSGVNRSTKTQIAQVSKAKDRYPGFFSMLADSMSELSLEAAERLRDGDMRGLGRLLTADHAALGSMGVSNGTLDGMVDLFASLGGYGAKLTGAGGGGSVVAVAPKAKEKSIVSGLTARGFETFSAKIPVEGVKSWLGP
ncbi:MAG: mevalonate kinase [Thaumarchaeota archaeon]|nr:mevalonate kinase [Nitrososphaerota archaeon]